MDHRDWRPWRGSLLVPVFRSDRVKDWLRRADHFLHFLYSWPAIASPPDFPPRLKWRNITFHHISSHFPPDFKRGVPLLSQIQSCAFPVLVDAPQNHHHSSHCRAEPLHLSLFHPRLGMVRGYSYDYLSLSLSLSIYIYGKMSGLCPELQPRQATHHRHHHHHHHHLLLIIIIFIIIIIIKPLLKIFNECRSSTGVGELNPCRRSSMNVEV